MPRLLNALIGTAVIAGMAIVPSLSEAQDRQAQDHKDAVTYHDKNHNDDHQWNDHENQAYGIWMKDNHRKNVDFAKLKASDQQTYWNWRHEHTDAQLKIDIR